jgi:signal transduction histidine kinase
MSYPRHEPAALPSYPAAVPRLPAAPPRPPLTKRMRPVHWTAIDVMVGAAAALAAMFVLVRPFGPAGQAVPADLVLAALVFFPVSLRRRSPVAAFSVLITVAAVVAGGALALSLVIFLAAAYVLYLVTAIGSRQTGLAALALALVVMALIVVTYRELGHGGAGTYVPVALAMIISWMTGYSVRQRRLYAQTLQEQAASSAVAGERLRIARELHDVVAHSMSVIAVQAGYGQYVIDSSPADARDALGAIQATSRDALEEMRRMLGVLRQQDVTPGAPATPAGPGVVRPNRAPLAPAPGLSDLDRLIERTCGTGVSVSVERTGRIRAVPAGVDLSAYRIIQEALTNVVRHAGGGARCTVSLGYGDTDLDVRVIDDGGLALVLTPARTGVAVSGTGHGIIGMRERAHLCGGQFSAGPLPDGGFQVAATLPLISAAAHNGAAADGSAEPGTGMTGDAGARPGAVAADGSAG